VWFKQTVHAIQVLGIALTGVGLWMYNNAKRDVEKGEKKMRQVEAVRDGLLPMNKSEQRILDGRGGSEAPAFGKEIHSSPKPVYASGYVNIPISKTSAIRTAGFELPAHDMLQSAIIHSKPVMNGSQPDHPYPSPPASTSSSPPTETATMPVASVIAPRFRGPSIDTSAHTLKASHASTVPLEPGRMELDARTGVSHHPGISLVAGA